ncbi:MAG: PQQ-binding-like beta-propeller repeat protein [Verrucomicrobiota bacterium]|nr:PQQ-binding-like beta-propeller repeat protein [Verrucomicrobiota bacterium]
MNATTRFRGYVMFGLGLGLALGANARNWPSWRGDLAGSGLAKGETVPLKWDTKRNVRWRVPLPDRGNSSPIVWGEKVFITQATDSDKRRTMMCFDKRTGELLWRTGVTYTKAEKSHKTNPYCSGSPATDGRVVVANYASAGIAAYDLDGQQLWSRDLGPQEHEWGSSTSPVLFGDVCILYHGPGPHSMLYALDKLTGRTVWKRKVEERDNLDRVDGFRGGNGGKTGAFSTPIIIRANNRLELILSEANSLRAINPQDGSELWHCDGLNPLVYTSPVYDGNVVLAMGGYFGASLAVKPGGSGDVTAKRLWHDTRAKNNRVATPVTRDGHAYFVNMSGFMICLDLKKGKTVYTERLASTGNNPAVWGSPILVGDRVYVTNQSGDTHVIRASPTFELLATNSVGEYSNSTLAVSDGALYLRTHKSLWCIGRPAGK